MPRNPNKTRCQVPGCRNWAMRGHTRCRAHRDAELGPRPVGAPRGNLNALKTGNHTHPLPEPELSHLARQLAGEPDLLPYHLGLTAQSIHSRTRDPHQTLLAFRATLTHLLPYAAHHQLAVECDHFLQRFSPCHREKVRRIVLTVLRPCAPRLQLPTFRSLVAEVEASLEIESSAPADPLQHPPGSDTEGDV